MLLFLVCGETQSFLLRFISNAILNSTHGDSTKSNMFLYSLKGLFFEDNIIPYPLWERRLHFNNINSKQKYSNLKSEEMHSKLILLIQAFRVKMTKKCKVQLKKNYSVH